MKKWFLKPEWSKEDEEGQSVVFGDEEPQHDPDDFPPPPPLDDEDEDDGSYDTTTPTPPACPPEMDGAEGVDSVEGGKGENTEGPHQQQVSDEARKRFSELFEQEVKPRRLFQVVAGVTVAATHLGVGCAFGVSGVMLPNRTHPEPGDDLFKDPFYATLFENMIVLGAAVGCVGTGPPQVWVGQRVTLLLSLPLALAAWVLLATSYSVWVLIAARAVQGLTLGFIVGPSSNYLVELAHTNLRGVLFAGVNVAQQLGYLFMYAAGYWGVSWRVAVLVCGCLATILPFIGLILLPDSPRWLASRDRHPEALKSMVVFRGPRYESRQELSGVMEQLDKRRVTPRDQLRALEKPEVLCFMLLFTFLLMASQFSGSFVTSLYTLQIFHYANGELSPGLSAVVVSAIRLMGAVFHLIVVEHLSRKFLLVGAFLLCAGTMALLGSSLYDQAHTSNLPLQSWLPLASLATYSFFSNSGLSILELLREEIIPTSVRSTAVSFLSCLFFVGSFLAMQTYFHVVAALGQHGVFWLYSFFNFILAVLGGLALRETRGASLEEISARTHRKEKQPDTPDDPGQPHHTDDSHYNPQNGCKVTHLGYNEMKVAPVQPETLRRSNGSNGLLKSSPSILVHESQPASLQRTYKPVHNHHSEDTNSLPVYPPSKDLPYASITDGCVRVFFLNQQ